MTADQLKTARAAHWRQNGNPILTLEDAQSWFEQHPLSLFTPRHAQLPAPAPSFAEACHGAADITPSQAAIEQARELLVRLIESGKVVALNLFGTLGEQPDFLAQTEILPFVIALRGERDWKQAPVTSGGHKVSPLVLELWKVLEREGPLTVAEAREKLGRELTEAAVLRALNELWQPLRAIPAMREAGRPAQWELLQLHHRAALTTGSAASQVTAISLLVSMYLQSVYAATGEEIEIFLSPLVSRSRVREAVRGLSATRQIHSLSMDAQTYYFLEGGLPEFAPEAEVKRPEPARRSRFEKPSAPAKFATGPVRFSSTPISPSPTRQETARRPRQFSAGAGKRSQGRSPERGPGRGPRRGDDKRPRTQEKPRWPAKERPPTGPAFGARTPPPGAHPSRPPHPSPPHPGGTRPPRPGGDWKRKSAAPGGSKESWRKFPQRPNTSDRPEIRSESPAQNRTQRRDTKPRWDRSRAPDKSYSAKPYQRGDQQKGPRKNTGAPDRSPAGQGFQRPKRNVGARFPPKFPSRSPSKPDEPATEKAGFGRRPFSPPGSAPINPSGRKSGFKSGGFKARGSGSHPFSPRFSKSGGTPRSEAGGNKGSGKRSFRDRNLGKKKPEA